MAKTKAVAAAPAADAKSKTDPKGDAKALAKADAKASKEAAVKAKREAAAAVDDTPKELGLVGGFIDEMRFWIKERGLWWVTSVTAHAVVLSTLLLLTVNPPKKSGEAPVFEAAKVDNEVPEPPLDNFDVGDTPIEPTELSTDTLTMNEAPAVDEQINGSPDEAFEEAGGGMANGTTNIPGMGNFDVKAIGPGPVVKGEGGAGAGKGSGNNMGSGGAGYGFGGRGAGVRKAMLGTGGTKQSERAVAAALRWLARHQQADGSWSLSDYTGRCTDRTCTGAGTGKSDTAATAMGLLPFLAAGQTHDQKGPYQKTIYSGIYWLLKNQKQDGSLISGSGNMYSHGLATIALCEAYGMSGGDSGKKKDRQIGGAAQQAINFIASAQDPKGGGWRYAPRTPGDTSVVGWQVMGCKSGMMAGLSVPSPVFEGAHKFLKSVASGKGGTFGYTDPGASPTMSAVGLLCIQYLGAKRDDPAVQDGMAYLMKQLPRKEAPNVYYWYYATQVMHNLPGSEWDMWNRNMRRILIESQRKEGCAAGSWDADRHPHAEVAGRLFVTSLSCLTLEVYYRYLPLYKLDGGDKGGGGAGKGLELDKK